MACLMAAVYTLNFAIEAIRALVGDYYLRVKGYNLAQLDEVVPCERMCLNCIITENCSLRDERVDQELRGGRVRSSSSCSADYCHPRQAPGGSYIPCSNSAARTARGMRYLPALKTTAVIDAIYSHGD